MNYIALIFLAGTLTCSGCIGSFGTVKQVSQAPSVSQESAECSSLDREHAIFGDLAVLGMSLSGGGGISSISTDDKSVRVWVSISLVAIAAVSAVMLKISADDSVKYVRLCTK